MLVHASPFDGDVMGAQIALFEHEKLGSPPARDVSDHGMVGAAVAEEENGVYPQFGDDVIDELGQSSRVPR